MSKYKIVVSFQMSACSRSNDFNKYFVGFVNQGVEVSGCQSYENEMHNEGLFIRYGNVKVLLG